MLQIQNRVNSTAYIDAGSAILQIEMMTKLKMAGKEDTGAAYIVEPIVATEEAIRDERSK